MKIAVVNSGSSSLKCKVFEMPSCKELASKHIEHIGEDGSGIANHKEALEALGIDFSDVAMIGHRVVHGAEEFHEATLIDQRVKDTIKSLIPLAPLHNPANLQGIEILSEIHPEIPQVAVFDTAFHYTLDEKAYLYPLPYEMYEKEHIRRYGFHGTSHEYLLKQAAKKLGKKVEDTNILTLHLGNGESICAIKNGKSIDTSMGFTPLEGLMMGSRSGDIDPEIVIYLQKSLGLSVDEVDVMLNKKSGLIGICGDNDVRHILKREDERAKLAITMMVRRVQKYMGAYLAVLEGDVDAIVFSGGIGEHSRIIREKILDNKMFKNIKTLVIETDEELEIALECVKVLECM